MAGTTVVEQGQFYDVEPPVRGNYRHFEFDLKLPYAYSGSDQLTVANFRQRGYQNQAFELKEQGKLAKIEKNRERGK